MPRRIKSERMMGMSDQKIRARNVEGAFNQLNWIMSDLDSVFG